VVIVTAEDMLSRCRCREGYSAMDVEEKDRFFDALWVGPVLNGVRRRSRAKPLPVAGFRLSTEISIHRTKAILPDIIYGEKTDIAAKPARRPPPRRLCDSMLLGTIRSLASRLRLIPRKNWLSRPLPSEPATDLAVSRMVTHATCHPSFSA
jgi:hypothetical protein